MEMTGRVETVWRYRVVPTLLLAAGLAYAVGCREDARLAGRVIPHVEVRTVQDQGVTLGPEASPKEVAFVLLRAIRDDIRAGSDLDARRRALKRQLAVCDPDYMYARYQRFYGDRAVAQRDEWVYKKVNLWAPTLAYYADAFDFDLPTAAALMKEGSSNKSEDWTGQTTNVDLPVADPAGISGADVIVRVRLHRRGGEEAHWRVFGVGFAGRPQSARSGQPDDAASSRDR